MAVLGNLEAQRLPVFAFVVLDRAGAILPHGLICSLLNDLFGVQAYGGTASAGGYSWKVLKA